MAGRSGRCARCGHMFTIPKQSVAAPDKAPAKPPGVPKKKAQSEYIGVACRVCQTRLFGRLSQVGQELKCPDCGATTVLKAPTPEKPKSLPAALEGDQYELWDADGAPLPSELLAAQPKYIAVSCRLCGTLMHATEAQIGKQLTCPDCATRTLVELPVEPRAKRDVLVSDQEAYQLDETAPPPERPPAIQTEYKGMLYEQEHSAELAREAAKLAQGKKLHKHTDVRGRPILPRWPLLSDVLPFLLSRGVPLRWAALSAFGALNFALATASLPGLSGIGGSVVANSMGAISGMCFLILSFVFGVIWLAALASVVITIVTESSEGNSVVSHWPTIDFTEWLAELVYLLITALSSAVPGGLIGQFVAPDSIQKAIWIAGSMWLCFPVIMLSQLDLSSPFAVLSAKVLMSLLRCPFSWLLFYVESALLVAGCIVAAMFIGNLLLLLVIVIPLSMAALLLYARLLGRLAWILAEATPGGDSADAGK